MVRFLHLPALTLLLAAVACTTEEGGGTPLETEPLYYDEDDDEGNQEPFDAEELPDNWTTELVVRGTLHECDWDNDDDSDWPWTGDNDSYEVEVPDDGFVDIELSWEANNLDGDFIVFINPSGSQWTPDHQAAGVGSNETWVPDDEFSRGDDMVIVVACPQGPDNSDYELSIRWER